MKKLFLLLLFPIFAFSQHTARVIGINKYSNDKNLGRLENEASSKKIGLFQDPNTVPPWIFREEKRNGLNP